MSAKAIDDKYGYDRHEIMRSYMIPTVIAILLIGWAASIFLTLLPATHSADGQMLAEGLDRLIGLMSKEIIDLSFSQSHVLASLAFVSSLIIAIVLARYVRNDNKEYMSAYPYLDDFYSEDQKRKIRRTGRGFMLASLPFFVAGAVVAGLGAASGPTELKGIALLLFAAAAWLLVHGIMWLRRVEIFAYNYRALDHVSIYELQAEEEFPDRDIMIAEKKLRAPQQTAKRVVIVAGVIVALCLYYMPSIETPFYWVAIVVAIAIAGCIGIYSESRARALAEHMRS